MSNEITSTHEMAEAAWDGEGEPRDVEAIWNTVAVALAGLVGIAVLIVGRWKGWL